MTVEEFDSHGTSRAQLRGRTIEVEHGIPGEIVDGLVFGKRRRWARILDVVEASPDRVVAPCPHFHKGCGGCQWQMLAYQSQLDRKLRNINSEFANLAAPIAIKGIHAMTSPWRYRVTAALSLGRQAGFRRHGTQSIVALDDCPISHPLIGRLAAALNRALGSADIPNFLGQVSVEARVVDAPGGLGLHTCIIPSPGSDHASIKGVRPLAQTLGNFEPVVGVVYRHKQHPPELLYGEPFGTVHIKRKPFAVTAAAFFQTNMELLPTLVDSMLKASKAGGSDQAIDVYGGVGTFGLFLADRVDRVIAIELDPVGVEAARRSAEMQNVRNIDTVVGKAEAVMGAVDHADIVIVDPPRAGLTPQVIECIGRLRPRRILYISCLARSLARDIMSLQQFGYRPEDIQAFDFYPQTYHVELFTTLHLQGSG